MEQKEKVRGWSSAVQLPRDQQENEAWQKSNRRWWEDNPMRYDWREPIAHDPGSPEFFREVDRRFFRAAAHYLPPRSLPFDRLIDFPALAGQDVLEIGVGAGSHAQLLAGHARTFTGIDLTENGTQVTRRRFKVNQLDGSILQMDAEQMAFRDDSFDFIWSWGVIHHSANTGRILAEMARVLRPGGRAVVMVYHRSFWKYWIETILLRGLLQGKLRQASGPELLHHSTDGAIARHYRIGEWKAFVAPRFEVEKVRILGQKTDLLAIPPGRIKDAASRLLPDPLARFFTNNLRQGSFLVAHLRRRSGSPGHERLP